MAMINMHDAKTQLSDLVARAEAGEDIIIARRNRPVVRLVPVDQVVGFGESEQAGYDPAGMREAIAAGREFTIMQDGKPVAKVIPVDPESKRRGWGAWEGRCQLPDTFFEPLPEDELDGWDGSDEPSA